MAGNFLIPAIGGVAMRNKLVVLWFVCGLIAYQLARVHRLECGIGWTREDRKVAIVLTVGGPVSLVIALSASIYMDNGCSASW